ncbi:ribokinase [Candidatus Magnetoovum chiemensis]|nr:ribokinase [Candidatus Magnetoovum chiemensis]
MLVCGLGQCTLDYIAVVDDYPQEDMKFEVPKWNIYGGGPAATALVALSRFGVKTRLIGLVSDDPAASMIKEELIKENVDIKYIVEKKGGVSQTAFILANKTNGARTIFWSKPSVNTITAEELPKDFLNSADFLHLDGLMMEAAITCAKMAKTSGVPVMYDAGSVREGSDELINLCDYVVCSEKFSAQYCKQGHEQTLKRLLSFGLTSATVTLGPKGSITAKANKLFHTPAYKVNVIDTTGAGDVFHGAYIYGILQHWEIEKIVRFASWAAALKCTKTGGRDGIPTLQQALKFTVTNENA